jgi:hypothetical protein
MMLTERQRFCLEWLRQSRQSKIRWMRNGKDAYGPPEKWDAIELVGAEGSIRISVTDWEALRPFKRIAPIDSGFAFVPNEAGLAMLSSANREVSK